MSITTTDGALLRLLQLSSASLPVGGYAFSQGLEYAIDIGWVRNIDDTRDWLSLQLLESLAQVDCPLLLRCHRALQQNDTGQLQYWNHYALACRETRELRLTDTATGNALIRLLAQLHIEQPMGRQETSFITAFAIAAHHWHLNEDATVLGLVWGWLENQVAAATKLVPLGQSQAQQLIGEIQQQVPAAIARAQQLQDSELGAGLPALAIASAKHEHQYSRLFRS
ncbi:urease accessory protein UreF [Microbulbifer hydrolyticus]|uniref:Urease accessory protein UreF n=1 Tax=Microbulbifer hydrolyticus TaxID=48074 RepID=A0A6P1T931_9GAMM|nr:urease accessory UreF family protein [Microbulbifer hydrolyticus]MBB5211094.1 urease accessory protein [Microbulbifer hydrolyticus]QHQ38120.1 urease accessory protein UreF [Microbulbifer hydrolyticus]